MTAILGGMQKRQPTLGYEFAISALTKKHLYHPQVPTRGSSALWCASVMIRSRAVPAILQKEGQNFLPAVLIPCSGLDDVLCDLDLVSLLL